MEQKMEAEIYYPEVEILNKLNEITGSRFREIKSNLSKIKALLKAGFTEVEIIEVIQLKNFQWSNNPEMSGYLCPKTLFRESNFEKYYNEVQQVKRNPEMYAKYYKKNNKIATYKDYDATISDLYG